MAFTYKMCWQWDCPMPLIFLSPVFIKFFADDVLVFGCDYDSFKSNVISFLDRCVEKDLHLNPDKIQINIPNVPFFGQVLIKEGLRPDLHKVDVVKQLPTPTNVTELQSFLGSVNYLCKFIPYLSDLRQPLQGLLKSDSEFLWTQVHDKAFKNLKQAICKDISLQFFDSDLPLYMSCNSKTASLSCELHELVSLLTLRESSAID